MFLDRTLERRNRLKESRKGDGDNDTRCASTLGACFHGYDLLPAALAGQDSP